MNIGALITSSLLKYLKKAWEKDRDHHLVLLEPWVFPSFNERVPDYDGENVIIHNSTMTIMVPKSKDACDGATGVPDKIGKNDFRPGSIVHDILCQEMRQIAKAWGWPVKRVRKLMDNIFYGTNLHYASKFWSRVYDEGVRKAGAVYFGIKHLFWALLFGWLLIGCSGCSTPVDPFGPGEWQDPVYEVVKDKDMCK